ncbi:MAG: TauD/TfdA family dioxygenase [Alphaproteobacteria bacterium]|nr:TauD/TfdA family dioxygenase [Alphaproteobacteria bacterium]
MQITPLTPHTGADILGVDIASLSDAEFQAIYRAWLDRGVIRFRDQKLTVPQLEAFSARFGPLEEFPGYSQIPDEFRKRFESRYVTVISNIKEDGRPIGGLGNAEAAWHSDMTYNAIPPTASVLYSVEIPPEGGDTFFVNQHAAWEALPDELKARIEGLSIKHDASHTSVGDLRLGYSEPASPVEAPGAVHPAVITHPETGRKTLFLGRRDWAYVMGLPLAESERLLDELWSYAAPEALVWRQVWQVGDVVVWDNRSVLHRRDEFDDRHRRLLRRCQVLAREAA